MNIVKFKIGDKIDQEDMTGYLIVSRTDKTMLITPDDDNTSPYKPIYRRKIYICEELSREYMKRNSNNPYKPNKFNPNDIIWCNDT